MKMRPLPPADIEAVLQEGQKLELEGKLDPVATRRLEAQLHSIADRLDKEAADGVAAINAEQLTTSNKSTWGIIKMGFFLFAFTGIVLEFTVGRSFVFAYTAIYQAAIPALFAICLPLFVITFFLHERKSNTLAHRYPTWLVRWMLMFPIVVLTASAVLIFSPFGWSALAGWVVVSAPKSKTAKILSLEPLREPKRIGKCNQAARVEIGEASVNICVEGRIRGATPKVGDAILVTGKESVFGFFVEELRVK